MPIFSLFFCIPDGCGFLLQFSMRSIIYLRHPLSSFCSPHLPHSHIIHLCLENLSLRSSSYAKWCKLWCVWYREDFSSSHVLLDAWYQKVCVNIWKVILVCKQKLIIKKKNRNSLLFDSYMYKLENYIITILRRKSARWKSL